MVEASTNVLGGQTPPVEKSSECLPVVAGDGDLLPSTIPPSIIGPLRPLAMPTPVLSGGEEAGGTPSKNARRNGEKAVQLLHRSGKAMAPSLTD